MESGQIGGKGRGGGTVHEAPELINTGRRRDCDSGRLSGIGE
jgi:hypothetical protein